MRAHPYARALPHGDWSLLRPSAPCTWARASCGFVLTKEKLKSHTVDWRWDRFVVVCLAWVFQLHYGFRLS